MRTEQFEEVINNRIETCKSVLCSKAEEYATDDRLHNFKVAGELQKCTAVKALGGMMAKHTVSVYDLIDDSSARIFTTFPASVGAPTGPE